MEEEGRAESATVVVETPAASGMLPAVTEHNFSNLNDFGDSLADSIINCKSIFVNDINRGGVIADLEYGEIVSDHLIANKLPGFPASHLEQMMACMLMGLNPHDPMIEEAQFGVLKNEERKQVGYLGEGTRNPSHDSNEIAVMGSGSSNSCPYPLGFAPIKNCVMQNGDDARVHELPQFEHENENNRVVHDDRIRAEEGSLVPERDNSIHLRYHTCSDSCVCALEGGCEAAVPIVVVIPPCTEDQSVVERSVANDGSEESLYRINECASGWHLLQNGKLKELSSDLGGLVDKEFDGVGSDEEEEGSNETRYMINVLAFRSLSAGEGESAPWYTKDLDCARANQNSSIRILNDGDNGGGSVLGGGDKDKIKFCDEEEVVARLSNRKIARKKRFKKHRQTRLAPCIQVRTLPARFMSVESVNMTGGLLCAWNEEFFVSEEVKKSGRILPKPIGDLSLMNDMIFRNVAISTDQALSNVINLPTMWQQDLRNRGQRNSL
ncbi:hypothetical protein PIB30_098936 [Stylosanthes scabra]|uniref:CCT domain-containing protein n=1 Tax=Stylosanthes scabra TaxID=79078 RepID=A0ABU6YXD8_9FABA|nr:hypothetical protein [Stylosanthes scabra]